jgi:pyruvate/2-oxoglutarate dehydrogenase complex dihydrolipoamide dehydrogenase (E3) component
MERVAGVIRSIEPHDSPERFRGLGVNVILGDGRFVSPAVFEVDGRRLTASTFVVATGSRPVVPAIPGIADVGVLTNETLFDLREPVPHLIVLGSGPIGSEMAQAFRRLGSQVTVIDIAPRILPREDADLVEIVFRQLTDEGIDYRLGATVVQVEHTAAGVRVLIRERDGTPRPIDGTHLLAATGRIANIENLGLDAADVAVDRGRIVADAWLRTTNRDVFVIGDAAGGLQFTHLAEHHAGVVLRNAIFRMKWAKPSPIVPACVYTDPELARVGLSETDARTTGVAHRVYRFPLADIDRARTDGITSGMAKIVTTPRGRLLGAAVVGPQAGEIIGEYALALAKGMSAADISGTIHAYPTLAQVNRRVADERRRAGLTPGARRWIQRVFRLRGN